MLSDKLCQINTTASAVNDDKQIAVDELKRWAATAAQSVALYSPYSITPSGSEMVVGVDRSYDDKTIDSKVEPGLKKLGFRVILQTGQDNETLDAKNVRFPSGPISVERLPGDDAFAKSVGLADGTTRLRFDVPEGLSSLIPLYWNPGRITVIACEESGKPAFIGQLDTSYSGRWWSLGAALGFVALVYVLAAIGVSFYENRWRIVKVNPVRCLDPVVMCSGPDLRGSMSRLQVLYFTVIVSGLLLFILLRVGLLSDLSQQVLLLLGVSAFGAAATKVTENNKERIDFEKWAWLVKKRWLPPNGPASLTVAKWSDILTGNDGFDVYHFQMLVFSLVVGVGLLKVGYANLATFALPQSLVALLGLSQVVYVAGKIVDQPGVHDLNDALKKLMDAEDAFMAKSGGARNLDEAKQMVAEKAKAAANDPNKDTSKDTKAVDEYQAYNKLRGNIRPMLDTVFTGYNAPPDGIDRHHGAMDFKDPVEFLEPGYPYPEDDVRNPPKPKPAPAGGAGVVPVDPLKLSAVGNLPAGGAPVTITVTGENFGDNMTAEWMDPSKAVNVIPTDKVKKLSDKEAQVTLTPGTTQGPGTLTLISANQLRASSPVQVM